MEIARTIKLKLNINSDLILPTIKAYTKAYNYVCKIGWNDKDFNGVSLHHKTYEFTREEFQLPAQLACSARMRATESLKSTNTKLKKNGKASQPKSLQIPIRLDARSFTVWFERNEISIVTLTGRIKIPIQIPEYFKQYTVWKRASADLFTKNGKVYLSLVMTQDIPEPMPNEKSVIGIDRGINNLAVTSNNKFFSGKNVKRISKRYQKIRSKLQACGSKSAKRHLRKISGKENRFKTDINHVISKKITNSVPKNSIVVLEKLTDIRKSKLRKKQRTELNKWKFFQLEQFLKYKLEAKNCIIECVCPRYTSQTCSKCGHQVRSNRKGHVFKCKACGFELNADLVASRNIKSKFLESYKFSKRVPVNEPIVAAFIQLQATDSFKR